MELMRRWWRDVGERVAWTAIQAGVAVLIVQVAKSGTVSAVRWPDALDIAVTAAVLSFGKGLAVYRVGEIGTAGTVDLRP